MANKGTHGYLVLRLAYDECGTHEPSAAVVEITDELISAVKKLRDLARLAYRLFVDAAPNLPDQAYEVTMWDWRPAILPVSSLDLAGWTINPCLNWDEQLEEEEVLFVESVVYPTGSEEGITFPRLAVDVDTVQWRMYWEQCDGPEIETAQVSIAKLLAVWSGEEPIVRSQG
jgi:hypothetical protein